MRTMCFQNQKSISSYVKKHVFLWLGWEWWCRYNASSARCSRIGPNTQWNLTDMSYLSFSMCRIPMNSHSHASNFRVDQISTLSKYTSLLWLWPTLPSINDSTITSRVLEIANKAVSGSASMFTLRAREEHLKTNQQKTEVSEHCQNWCASAPSDVLHLSRMVGGGLGVGGGVGGKFNAA